MCFLHHGSGPDDFDEWPEPVPRSHPYLTWAVPVDAVELGASLETFEALSPQIQMLRLCHRFGCAPLSTMPQEIIDLIISILYQSTREIMTKRWDATFQCFQGRCTPATHVDMDDADIEEAWLDIFSDQGDACCPHHLDKDDFDPADYDIEEKREMVIDFFGTNGEWAYKSLIVPHEEACHEWVEMLCLCRLRALGRPNLKTFLPFQEILRSRFGLEAVFLHETLSDSMARFLPDADGPSGAQYFTSCFLILRQRPAAGNAPRKPSEDYSNPTFLRHDTHLAFRQRIDSTNLGVSEKEKSSFARTLRVLEIAPSFHLTELEDSLASRTADDALSKISDGRLDGWPPVSSLSVKEKKQMLEVYLKRKRREVGNQQWPQLMLLAASDTVSPTPSSG